MSDTSNTANSDVQSTIDAMTAEIERLKSELETTKSDAQNAVTTPQEVSKTAEVATTASTSNKVIGAATDPRGGYVIAYSDGTTKLENAPEGNTPYGNAPEGKTYEHFFTNQNGEEYVFVASDNSVETVENPVRNLP